MWRRHIPYWVNFLAQNVTKNCYKTAIRSKNCSKTVKTANVTTSHSLLGQFYGKKSKMWHRHIPYWVNLMAQNVTKNCSKTAKKAKKVFKHSKNRKCDDVTFLIGSTLWPRTYVANSVITSKMAFFQMAWRDAAIGLIYSGTPFIDVSTLFSPRELHKIHFFSHKDITHECVRLYRCMQLVCTRGMVHLPPLDSIVATAYWVEHVR